MPAPYDPEQAARQRREQAEETVRSAGRARSATVSPQKSSGGGGFVMNAPGSGSDKAADPPGKYDGGLSGGVIHTAEQEQNIKSKAASGGVITNADLGDAHDYLGHFSRDDVAAKGHNAGHRKKGKPAVVKTVARRGFRKLPGSAVPQIGHAKYGHADTGLRPPRHEREAQAKAKADMTRAMKRSPIMQHDPIPLGKANGAPRAVSDVKLSLRHEKDSLARDLSHAKDHMESAAKHRKHIAERKKQLGKQR